MLATRSLNTSYARSVLLNQTLSAASNREMSPFPRPAGKAVRAPPLRLLPGKRRRFPAPPAKPSGPPPFTRFASLTPRLAGTRRVGQTFAVFELEAAARFQPKMPA